MSREVISIYIEITLKLLSYKTLQNNKTILINFWRNAEHDK